MEVLRGAGTKAGSTLCLLLRIWGAEGREGPFKQPVVNDVWPSRGRKLLQSEGDFDTFFMAFLIAVLVLAFITLVHETVMSQRRQQHGICDQALLESLSHVFMEGTAKFGTALFLLSVASGVYWLIEFEGSGADPLPSSSSLNDDFRLVAILAVALLGCGVLYSLHRQTSVDIFFVDWEKPKTTVGSNGTKQKAPVSAWREIFVANELNKLQSQRRSSPGFAIVVVLLLLTGADLQSSMTANASNSEVEIFLRYGIIASLYMLAGFAQVIYKSLIVYRIKSHPVHDFVDILPLTNISVFIFPERLSGHYIHGRSASSTSELDFQGLHEQLRTEEDMQVSARGLMSGDSTSEFAENQVFRVFVNSHFRRKYDDLLERIQEEWERAQRSSNRRSLPQEATMAAKKEVSMAFHDLVNQAEFHPNLVRPKATYESCFGPAPYLRNPEESLWLHDFQHTFKSTFMLGAEPRFILFEASLFGAIDLGVEDVGISAFITYMVSKVIGLARSVLSMRNISRKSLIDSTFIL